MNPECCRYFYGSANKRLRRARRLYARLIFEGCWNGGAPTILDCAKRAKERGLYAAVTADKDIAWSIYRKMFKLFNEANPGYKYSQPKQWEGWWNFKHDFPWLSVK